MAIIVDEYGTTLAADGARHGHTPEHRQLWAALTEATADAQRILAADVADAVGELVNMVGGGIKSK